MARFSTAIKRDCTGVTNRTLVQYLEAALRNKKKVIRPDWCSPIRWRIFGTWYKQYKARIRLTHYISEDKKNKGERQ